MIDENKFAALLEKIKDDGVREEVRVFVGNTWREGMSEGILRARARLSGVGEEMRLDAHFLNWREEVQKSR